MPDDFGRSAPTSVDPNDEQQGLNQMRQDAQRRNQSSDPTDNPDTGKSVVYESEVKDVDSQPKDEKTWRPPVGSRIVETNAQGKPVTYEKDGVRYYSPDNVMWEKGYRTSTEYMNETRITLNDGSVIRTGGEARVDKPSDAAPAPNASADTVSQKELKQARAEVPGFDNLPLQERFNKMVELGIIEPGSKLINKDTTNFAYYSGTEVLRAEAIEKKIPLKKLVEQKEAEFQQQNLKLKDGKYIPIAEFNALPEKYRTVALRQGLAEMNRQIEADNVEINRQAAEIQQNYERYQDYVKSNYFLPDGNVIARDKLDQLKASNPEALEILVTRGVKDYEDAIADAKSKLSKYQSKDGKYNLSQAMLSGKPEVDGAIKLLFDQAEVKELERKLLPRITLGKQSNQPATTPQSMLPSVNLPPSVLAASTLALGGASIRPPTQKEVVILAVLGAVATGLAVGKGVSSVIETQRHLREMAKYQATTGSLPKPSDYLAISATGEVKPLSKLFVSVEGADSWDKQLGEIRRKAGWIIDEVPPFRVSGKDVSPPPIPADIKTGYTIVLKPAAVDTVLKPGSVPVVDTKLPGVTAAPEAIKQSVTSAVTTKAKDNVIEKLMRQPVYKENAAAEVARLMEQTRRMREIGVGSTSGTRTKSYQEYLAKLKLLAEAKRTLVASLSPTPVSGKVNTDALKVYYTYILSQLPKTGKVKLNTTQIKRLAASLAKIDTTTAAKTQLAQITDTAARTKLATIAATDTKTALKTATATRTASKAAIKSLTKAASKSAARTNTATRTLTKTATLTGTFTGKIPTLPRKPTSQQVKQFFKAVPGFVARRRGELGGKDFWIVHHYPYRPQDKLTFTGKPPFEVPGVRGKGSVAASAVIRKGIAPTKPIYDDTGAVDDILSFNGNKVNVESIQDRGSARISERPARLERFRPRLSSRGIRITPKTPKLR